MHGLRAWWTSAPRWVKVFGLVVIVLILLFVLLVVLGVHIPPPGGHSP